mmetsp:Transcript_64473/g.185293  ORF Transcript_64473/g.185293 Transcript_64473/m.185293 type:complete len:277 (-) Transcript_64473:66-896(-)
MDHHHHCAILANSLCAVGGVALPVVACPHGRVGRSLHPLCDRDLRPLAVVQQLFRVRVLEACAPHRQRGVGLRVGCLRQMHNAELHLHILEVQQLRLDGCHEGLGARRLLRDAGNNCEVPIGSALQEFVGLSLLDYLHRRQLPLPQPILDIRSLAPSVELPRLLALREVLQRRVTPHLESLGEVLLDRRVDLGQHRLQPLPVHLRSGLLVLWLQLLAVPAPRGVELDQYAVVLLQGVVEGGRRQHEDAVLLIILEAADDTRKRQGSQEDKCRARGP